MFEWYEEEVRCLEWPVEALQMDRPPVVFYGSSTIRLWKTLQSDLPGIGAVNLGFGGATLGACVYFFDRLVVGRRPGALVVYAGDNDLGDGASPEEVLGAYRALWEKSRLMLGRIPFAFISIKPSPARWAINDRIVRTNAMIRQEMEGRDKTFWIETYSALLGADEQPRRELYESDGLHLSPAGYRVWTERVRAQSDGIF